MKMKQSLRSFLLCAVLLAVLVGAYFAIRLIPQKYTRLDIPDTGVSQISQASVDFARSLDRDVTVYLISEDGHADEQFSLFLSRYTDETDRITVKVINSTQNPDFVAPYLSEYQEEGQPALTLSDQSLIVESDLRYEILDYYDLYEYSNTLVDYYAQNGYASYFEGTYDENTGTVMMTLSDYNDNVDFFNQLGMSETLESSTDYTYFKGESRLTSALDYVTATELPTLYRLIGHGDAALPEKLTELLTAGDLTVTDINLQTVGAVPSDASCLVVYAPARDISQAERDMILDYMNRGGHMLLVTSPAVTASCPNLMSVPGAFGMTALEGTVYDDNTSNYIQSKTTLLPVATTDNPISYYIGNVYRMTVRVPSAHAISYDMNDSGVTALLTTSSAGGRLSVGETLTTLSSREVLTIAAEADRTVSDGKARLIWFGSSKMFEDSVAEQTSYANDMYFIYALGYMTDSFSSSYASLAAVDVNGKTLTELSSSTPIVWTIVFVAVALAFLIGGLVVYFRRRRVK